jgi:peptide/nickel transport system substrate-binding protein
MEEAARLLAEAGWTRGKDGLLHKDGQPFEFTILVNQGNDQRIKIAVIIQSHLKKLGITAKIRTVEWTVFLNDFISKGFFDTMILGWSTTLDPDPHSVWHSDNAVPGGLNFIGYKNAEVDALIEEGRSSFDLGVRKRCYDRVQEILHDEQPYAFLYVPYALPAVHKRFHGLEPVPVMGVDHNLPEWWVPENEQIYRNLLKP